ncbi:MAG TPA: 2Fe-2S iron-sulfur cluster-binding protein, partial [Pyrinomonadaceae bacterium]|nr:2Fe-2S iron-sulfur cluster-binding protein [Pyrinomonadaceae bacterium]
MTLNLLENALASFNESAWTEVVDQLLPAIHEVDRNAVRIWFRFYPLDVVRYLESAEDPEQAMRGVNLQGDFGLLGKIDTSHRFLYGHRYWPHVRQAIIARSESDAPFSGIGAEISGISEKVAAAAGTKVSLTIAISAVGLMTLVQAGFEDFKSSPGAVEKPAGLMAKSPEVIVSERRKDDSQGLLGFLKTVDKKFTIHFNAFATGGSFRVMNEEEIASASQKDHSRDWQNLDSRSWDGPVPIECTAASCGTCWVGVIAGENKLSEVSRRERRAMKVFGYNSSGSDKPVIRLACQAKAYGNVTIVIPPWNAVFGKKVY